MGSITDILSTGSGESGSLSGGSATGDIVNTIAETIGDIVATALKSVLGNLS
ncbi:hypothetical protein [Rhodococcus sp. IEGM 1408]|uniref:hypothetical protein n=1 Tax=Rhodococcus sp. IEGM 1408 TaxID=3082220 RepID=UPI0029533CB2|nr:hypothetical protein [Rhodococcus sp. IEGM 1408]MDV8001591.1 hypothetical protein [Rhodococcus sp. IEGM 1408]